MYSFYYPEIYTVSFFPSDLTKVKRYEGAREKDHDGNLVWGYMPILFVKFK